MPVRRVALIFDDTVRPDTTGVYCRRALATMVEVVHVRPAELDAAPRTGIDLYLAVDDGLRSSIPADLRPAVWWAIDTHLDPDWYAARAPAFDLVVTAQRDGADALRAVGVNAAWLPLACDPAVHAKHDVPKEYDVCFVGNLFPGPREELVGLLRRSFPSHFVGRRFFEEMARTYSASRVVFNRSIRNDVNMRVFEALACGSLLMTNDLSENGLTDLFQDGVELATYRDADELVDKMHFYLARESVRERIAAAGRAAVLDRDTYRHRMEWLLSEADRRLARVSRSVPAVPPADPAAVAGPADPVWELDLLPPTARRILHLRCGDGRVGKAVKARFDAEVIGVEHDPKAAAVAAGRLDKVLVGDVGTIPLDFAPGSFDAVLGGDVLDHVPAPPAFLSRLRGWLRPEGCLILDVPNARHHSVLAELLGGDAGRAKAPRFTRRGLEGVLGEAEFRSDVVVPALGDDHAAWVARGRPGEVPVGTLRIGGLSAAEADEFYIARYRLRARPATGTSLTSVVVVTYNQLSDTRRCLDSLRQRTDEPYELIVVDNGSTDGTPEYLAQVPGCRVIANPENRGFPAAANQGLRAAGGDQVVLLNNDTVLTRGWLSRLRRALASDPRIGLVGPCSNRVSGPQQVPVPYGDDLAGLEPFAADWGARHLGVIEETDRLVGFCLLITRAVVDRVGLLDERFGLGCFEDDDYTLRAVRAGFRTVIARDAFVHHAGGRTFIGSGVDFAGLMARNQELFRQKWLAEASGPSDGSPLTPPPRPVVPGNTTGPGASRHRVRVTSESGLVLGPGPVRLSLCMIVRDNAGTIGPCLESIRPWVDEMVVVDTGSLDDTPSIARRLGARVGHAPWVDSFAAARNESLRHAAGEWLFWMDSDDTISPENGRKLRELIDRAVPANLLGFVMQVHCPGPGGTDDLTVVDHVKLFRNRPDLRFEGRIHEQILPAIRRAGGDVEWTDLFVLHSGYDHTAVGQERKKQRDLKLLQLELGEQPDHPFTLFNLGMTYADVGEPDRAVGYLERSLACAGPGDSHLRKTYALLAACHVRLGRHDLAREACDRGLRHFPEDLELRFRSGTLWHEAGRPAEAAAAYREVLSARPARYFSSMDRGIQGFKARQNLALAYQDMDDWPAAEKEWRAVTEEMPGYPPGWSGLGEVLLRQGKVAEAELVAWKLQASPAMRTGGLLLESRCAEAFGDDVRVRKLLETAVESAPEDSEPLTAWCRYLFERGTPDEAEPWAIRLVTLRPDDPSAHHNLGTIYRRLGRANEAVAAYRAALRLRPGYPTTLEHLTLALEDAGRHHEARGVRDGVFPPG